MLFHVLAIVNSAAVKNGVHVSVQVRIFHLSQTYTQKRNSYRAGLYLWSFPSMSFSSLLSAEKLWPRNKLSQRGEKMQKQRKTVPIRLNSNSLVIKHSEGHLVLFQRLQIIF